MKFVWEKKKKEVNNNNQSINQDLKVINKTMEID